MNTINFADKKILLFQKLLTIDNEEALNQLNILINNFILEAKSLDNIENIDINSLSFQEWNKIFMEEKDLNEYIPEYDMTLLDYRMKIYNAERSESFPINKFFKKLESYV